MIKRNGELEDMKIMWSHKCICYVLDF